MSYLFNNLVGFVGNAVDAFNRLKVSNPFTLFDSQHRFQANDKWDSFGVTGGTATFAENESAINMTVGTTLGSKITRETKRVFAYQPGKSLLVLNTFAFATPKEGLRQRVGYFGLTGGATAGIPYNGIFLEQNGLTLSFVQQSASLNTTTTINQKDWNSDTFDGLGACGRILDVSKANILWMDIEWLGVGDVRCGFFVDGRPVVAHTFHHDNLYPTTYMTTATLPMRQELENLTAQASDSTAKSICASVLSEGGYEAFSRRFNISTSTTPVNLPNADTYYPVLSIRLNPNRLDAAIVPSNISAIVTTNTWVQYRITINGTFTGTEPTWTTHYGGSVDYALHNPALTGITGAKDIIGGYIQNNGNVDISSINDFNFQLGRTQTGVSDILTMEFAAGTSNTKVLADLSWFELV